MRFRLNIARKREDVVVRLRTLGRHQIYNALQAAAIGYFVGLDLDEIREGLETVQFPDMRMEPMTLNGVRYVKDCYNANVPSTRAALGMLKETPCHGRRIAVLGDMRELGVLSEQGHAEVGRLAATCGLDVLLTVGTEARWMAEAALEAGMEMHRVLITTNLDEARAATTSLVREGDLVLLKGSRALGLEKLVSDECSTT